MAPGGSAVLPWLCGVGTGATLCCFGHQWQSQQLSWNIYSRLVRWAFYRAKPAVDIRDKVKNDHWTFTHAWCMPVWITLLYRMSVTKSKMIIEHLLTTCLCVGYQWHCQIWSIMIIQVEQLLTPGADLDTVKTLLCVGYQWQSQKWSLNMYSLPVGHAFQGSNLDDHERFMQQCLNIYSRKEAVEPEIVIPHHAVLDVREKVKNDHLTFTHACNSALHFHWPRRKTW